MKGGPERRREGRTKPFWLSAKGTHIGAAIHGPQVSDLDSYAKGGHHMWGVPSGPPPWLVRSFFVSILLLLGVVQEAVLPEGVLRWDVVGTDSPARRRVSGPCGPVRLTVLGGH